MQDFDLRAARDQISQIDKQIIELLGQRNLLSKHVGHYKKLNQLPIVDEAVAESKQKELVKHGKTLSLSPKFVRRIWRNIHHYSIQTQEQVFGKELVRELHKKAKLERVEAKKAKRGGKKSKSQVPPNPKPTKDSIKTNTD